MIYQEAVKYLESFINYEKIPSYPYKTSLDLARMERLLELLGNPHHLLRSIHIAGTKGKGSVAAMTASILTEAGVKTGLYTSPHLVDFRERIRVNGHKISQEEVAVLAQQINEAIGQEHFTFFEVYTGLALMHFKNCDVDIVVLETGLGGRLDATRVVQPYVCGITSISFDHTDKLGHTLEAIAREKAGIVRENTVVISAPQHPEADKVIKDTCRDKQAKLFIVGEHIFFERVGFSTNAQTFNVKGIFGEYPLLKIPLLGAYQITNAAVAVGLVEALRFFDRVIPIEPIRVGLQKVRWPGRLEVIQDKPKVVIDGAQNKASAEALMGAIKENFSYKKLILILGISKDKDIKGVLQTLAPLADEIILVQADNPRSAQPAQLKEQLQSISYPGQTAMATKVEQAYHLALEKAGEDDLILVTGSFFILGEIPGYKVEEL